MLRQIVTGPISELALRSTRDLTVRKIFKISSVVDSARVHSANDPRFERVKMNLHGSHRSLWTSHAKSERERETEREREREREKES